MFKKYSQYIIIGFCFFFLWIYLQGTVDKVLFHELVPVKIPEEFYHINNWLSAQKDDFKVTLLPPQFDARILDWAPDRQINDFISSSSDKPTIGPSAPYSKLYYLFFETVIGNVPRLDKFFDILNAKYLIFRKDLPEDYSELLLNNLKNNPDLKEVNLKEIDPRLFFQKSTLVKKDSGEIQEKEYFAVCNEDRESYLQIFENKNFAPQFWAPENVSLVVGGMETLDILNSQENFNPVNQGLIFVNQEPNILEKIKNFKFKNIIFNNASLDDLIFSLIKNQYLINLAPLSQEGEGEWRKASTEEPLHGEWHRVINDLKISNWDFDFGKNLIYSEGGEKIQIPLQIPNEERYFLIVRYFQNNKGGKLKLVLDGEKKMVETLNLNNKFTTQIFNLNSLKKGEYSLTVQNLIGFNAINLIALVPEKKYQEYQEIAQEILRNNRILYIQKISPEMTIEPLEFDLPRESNYEVSLRLRSDQSKTDEDKEKKKEENSQEKIKEDNQSNEKERIIDIEELKKESIGDINLFNFGNGKYNLIPDLSQKISWQHLEKMFFGQKEKIPIYQRTKPTSILTVDNFSILDQGNLEINKKNAEDLESPTALKVSNLIPKIEVLQGSQVSERRGRLITDAIKVKEGQNFYLEYKFQGKNLKGVDARILFYGEDYDPIYQRTAFEVEDFMNDQIGNIEQKKISHFFGTPKDTQYIKIEFKAEPNLEKESWFEISDFKLFEEESLSGIDALMLSEDREEPEETEGKPTVSYEKINPTQYKISFSEVEQPFILAFAESYDPMWKLKEKNGEGYFEKRFNSLFSKNNDIFPHFLLYSVINGFYIDPQKLKTNELIIEYEPQNWFEAGLWISAGSMAISFLTFVVYRVYKKCKGRRDKKYA